MPMTAHDNQVRLHFEGRARDFRHHAAFADDQVGLHPWFQPVLGKLLHPRGHRPDPAALTAGRIDGAESNGLFDDR
jgi:hypothetical protein